MFILKRDYCFVCCWSHIRSTLFQRAHKRHYRRWRDVGRLLTGLSGRRRKTRKLLPSYFQLRCRFQALLRCSWHVGPSQSGPPVTWWVACVRRMLHSGLSGDKGVQMKTFDERVAGSVSGWMVNNTWSSGRRVTDSSSCGYWNVYFICERGKINVDVAYEAVSCVSEWMNGNDGSSILNPWPLKTEHVSAGSDWWLLLA